MNRTAWVAAMWGVLALSGAFALAALADLVTATVVLPCLPAASPALLRLGQQPGTAETVTFDAHVAAAVAWFAYVTHLHGPAARTTASIVWRLATAATIGATFALPHTGRSATTASPPAWPG